MPTDDYPERIRATVAHIVIADDRACFNRAAADPPSQRTGAEQVAQNLLARRSARHMTAGLVRGLWRAVGRGLSVAAAQAILRAEWVTMGDARAAGCSDDELDLLWPR